MKHHFSIFLLLLTVSPAGVNAQGTIVFNNLGNTDGSLLAKTNGLAFLQTGAGWSLLNEDINYQLWAGSSKIDLQLVHTWLLSDGSAKGISAGPGYFADPTASIFTIPGVSPGGRAVVNVAAWVGPYPDLLSAESAGMPIGLALFGYTTGGGAVGPSGFAAMPSLLLSTLAVPEPSSIFVFVFGAVVMVVFYVARLNRPV